MDYDYLAAFLNNGSELPEPNTKIVDVGGGIGVKYYNTTVVKYFPDGSIIVNTDGIRKKTTKNRINKYLPDGYNVKKINGKWYICKPDGSKKEFSDSERIMVVEHGRKKMEKQRTLEEAILSGAKAQFSRLCDDIITEQEDPAAAPVGTPPPPQGQEQADLAPQPTAEPQAAGGGESENAVQELADEIYELMKKEGDISEGFLQELYREKGYEEKDVSAALDILEKDGRAGKRSTFFVAVEDGDDQSDEAGITPGATEGDVEEEPMDMEEPMGAEAGGQPAAEAPPAPGGQASPPAAPMGMRNMRRNRKKNAMMGPEEEEGMEDEYMGDMEGEDEMSMSAVGDEYGMEDDSDSGVADKIDAAQDDLRDLVALVKSIEPQLDDIKASLSKGNSEVDNAMRSLKNSAKNLRHRNPYFNGGGANYPIYGEPTKKTGKR